MLRPCVAEGMCSLSGLCSSGIGARVVENPVTCLKELTSVTRGTRSCTSDWKRVMDKAQSSSLSSALTRQGSNSHITNVEHLLRETSQDSEQFGFHITLVSMTLKQARALIRPLTRGGRAPEPPCTSAADPSERRQSLVLHVRRVAGFQQRHVRLPRPRINSTTGAPPNLLATRLRIG